MNRATLITADKYGRVLLGTVCRILLFLSSLHLLCAPVLGFLYLFYLFIFVCFLALYAPLCLFDQRLLCLSLPARETIP
jgi:hypothetical protein